MAYSMHSRPVFNPQAVYVATNRLSVFNGVPIVEGERLPAPPKDLGARIKFTQRLRQLYELRRIEIAPAVDKNKTNKKEKT